MPAVAFAVEHPGVFPCMALGTPEPSTPPTLPLSLSPLSSLLPVPLICHSTHPAAPSARLTPPLLPLTLTPHTCVTPPSVTGGAVWIRGGCALVVGAAVAMMRLVRRGGEGSGAIVIGSPLPLPLPLPVGVQHRLRMRRMLGLVRRVCEMGSARLRRTSRGRTEGTGASPFEARGSPPELLPITGIRLTLPLLTLTLTLTLFTPNSPTPSSARPGSLVDGPARELATL